MIKFVYFDVGGVTIKDFSGTNNWNNFKKEIGLDINQYEKFHSFWDRYSDINTTRELETLKPLIEKEFSVKFLKNYSLLIDGFVNRFEINESIWPIIKEIQKTSKVGLLTNMYSGMFEEIKRKGLLPSINWNVIIDSSVVGLQKPDSDIYKLSEEKCGAYGGEIFFIDNTEKNLIGAQRLGWKTFLYDSANPERSSKELLIHYHKISS